MTDGRLKADPERIGDLFTAVSLSDQFENFRLPRGQEDRVAVQGRERGPGGNFRPLWGCISGMRGEVRAILFGLGGVPEADQGLDYIPVKIESLYNQFIAFAWGIGCRLEHSAKEGIPFHERLPIQFNRRVAGEVTTGTRCDLSCIPGHCGPA